MKKKNKKMILLVLLNIAMLIFVIVLHLNGLKEYTLVASTTFVIMFIYSLNYMFTSVNEENLYKRRIKKILKTYDSILVNSKKLPSIKRKNIIRVESINDLVNAQIEIRKPIYYKMELNCCSFLLLDNNEACIYILKVNDNVVSELEKSITETEEKKANKDNDYSIFNEIDKTMIVKFQNSKAYKISPVRDKKKNDENTNTIELI